MIFVILSFNSSCSVFVFQEPGQEEISQYTCLLSLQLKIIIEDMVMLEKLSGDVTFFKSYFFTLFTSSLEGLPSGRKKKRVGREESNIHLFLLWKIPDHYYKKVDADQIWIYRLLITYK